VGSSGICCDRQTAALGLLGRGRGEQENVSWTGKWWRRRGEEAEMHRFRWAWAAGTTALVLVAVGCGRPSLPGRHFSGEQAETTTSAPVESPLPEKPYFEWGDADAKVRVLAFFAIDDAHAELRELLEGLAEEHRGKVYVRYVDYRTPEGAAIFQRAEATGRAVMINGETGIDIETDGGFYTVDFVQEMGRFWTAEDLKKAIAQEVARQY